jgi:signal transduction histidine kinase
VSTIVSRLEESVSGSDRRTWLVRRGVGIVLVAAAYYLTGKAGLHLRYVHGTVTALWPPVGVGIAALLIWGPALWPGIVIADLAVGDYSAPLGTVFGQTAGNTLEVVVAVLLLRRLTNGRIGLGRVVDVLSLVLAAVVGTVISATFGTVSLRLGNVIPAHETWEVWHTWWLADLSGALVVAPAVLVWATARARFDRLAAAEGILLLGTVVALVELPAQRDVPYVVFPALIWAALRFGTRGAATAVLLTSSLTIWNTAHNAGPFVRDSTSASLLSTQLFVAVSALTSLVLAAVTAERVRAVHAERELAHEQAALRRIATLVAAEADPVDLFARVTDELSGVLATPSAAVLRFEEDGRATLLGVTRMNLLGLPVGSELPLSESGVLARVHATGEVQRLDTYENERGALVERLRAVGARSSVAAPVHVGGRLWGALVATSLDSPLEKGAERRLRDFADLVAQALANADAYDKLAASRARIVEAGDTERRRLERNLHDGAQQRLVSLALQLRIVRARLDGDPAAVRDLVAAAQTELGQALEELRELARGIHPAVLSERGLGPALSGLVARAPVVVELAELPSERLPEPVEAAAYYVVAESLTNVAKYAGASCVQVSVSRDGDRARVVVADDGIGGADASTGSGLRGLADRVEALDGRLRVDSPPGGGTRIEAEIPVLALAAASA